MGVPSSRQSPLRGSHPIGQPVGLRSRQGLTIALLFGGYAALYFCRADLSVGAPLIIDELSKRGMSHADAVVRMGTIASLGVLAYALGKLFLGGLGDLLGRPRQLSDRPGRRDRIHIAVRGGRRRAGVHDAWLGNG